MRFDCLSLDQLKSAVELATNDSDRIQFLCRMSTDNERLAKITFIFRGDKIYLRDFEIPEP